MRCEDIDRLLAEGAAAELDAEDARAHLRSCAECRALRLAGIPGPQLSNTLDVTARRIVRQDLRPLRPLPSNGILAAAVVTLLAVQAGSLSLLFGRSGWLALTPGSAAALVGFTALVTGLMVPALIWSMVPASAYRWRPAVPLLVFAAGYVLGVAALFPPGGVQRFIARGVPCMASGVVVALASSLVILLVARKGYAGSLSSIGALLGGSGALVGFVVLQLHCPILKASHLAVWHGLIIVIPIAVGFAAGWLFSRIR
ncbi:MAG: DUF1109 family protein [Bryobacterales bacterium]|nr:DUF1109 family protein [Bryobacterales bacterium]